MMVILKLPIAYLCFVVWWAVRAEPKPLEGAKLVADVPEPGPRGSFWRRRVWPRRFRPGPHGSPVRRPARAAPARARAEVER